MSDDKQIKFAISTLSVLKIILLLIGFYVLYVVRDILLVLFVSLIVASALTPWIDWMHNRKIPRALGVIFIYVILILLIGSAIYLIIPPIAQQVNDLSTDVPGYFTKISQGYTDFRAFASGNDLVDSFAMKMDDLSSNLSGATGGVFSLISGIFGGIFSFFLILIITFYMIVEESAMKKLVISIAPRQHQVYIIDLIIRMQKKVGLWLRGQLILSFIIFVLIYIGLTILGVKYALVLALIAGLTEFVPYLGPILAAIPAVLLAFTQSPILALFVILLYYGIQLLENNFIVPKIMQKVVGMNPIVSIAVLLIGFKIAGILGAIMAIPVTTAVSVFINDFFDRKERMEKQKN